MVRSVLVLSAVPFLSALGAVASADTIWVPDDHATIQEAVDAATDGDVVIVRPGTYPEYVSFHGKAIELRSELGPEGTTIQPGGILFSEGEGPDSVLRGFTIMDSIYGGGAIDCRGASPTIVGNVVASFHVQEGGAIYCLGGSPCIVGNTIQDNTAFYPPFGGYGGGLFFDDDSSPTIRDNLFLRNSSDEGGAIYGDGGSPTITGNTFQSNSSTYSGGAVYLKNFDAATITDNVFLQNQAGSGAGLGLGLAGAAYLHGNRYVQNAATTDGGGLSAWYMAGLVVDGDLFDRNTAGLEGGAIHASLSFSSTLAYCTFTGCSVTDPTVGKGGAVSLEGCTGVISDSILWGDTALLGPELAIGGDDPATCVVGYSDVQGGTPAVHVEANGTLVWGAGTIDADPLFLDPAAGDFRLQQDPCQSGVVNPCVDAGDPASPLLAGTTRSDWDRDAYPPDLGFHTAIPLASVTSRNWGTNPESYSFDHAPAFQSAAVATVDLAGTTGHDLAVLFGSVAPAIVPLKGGVLLVDLTAPGGELLGLPSASGPVASFVVSVPYDLSLAGIEVYTQALHVGGVTPYALSNAEDIVIGFDS